MKFMEVVSVGLGGFLGTLLRYVVGVVCQSATGASGFPIGTLIVNALGCFLMGVLQGAASKAGWSREIVIVLGVGVLGGFTTFSAFGWDWLRLLQAHKQGVAIVYVLLTLILGFFLVYAGVMLGDRMASAR